MNTEQTIRVLLVEDDPTDVLLATAALGEGWHFEVAVADRLGEALQLLRDRRFDVVLLDLGLPDSQGLDTLLGLHQGSPTVPVIVMTGRDDQELAVRAVQEGAQDYLVKNQVRDDTLGRSIRYSIERNRTEQILIEREERIRLLLDSTAEAIYGIDLQGHCTFANQACARLLGYSEASQFPGQDMHDLIHHTRGDGTLYPVQECRIHRAFRKGEGTHVDDEILWRADGSSFPAEYWSYPIRRSGQVVGAVVTFLDITERKHLEERFRQAQQRLEHVVASSPAVLYTLVGEGEDLRLAWVSENIRDMMGYPPEEVSQPKWCHERVHPEDLQRVSAEIQNHLFTHGRLTQEYRFRHQDGKYRWVRSEMRLLRDAAGNPVEVVGSWSDITERKHLEDQYRHAQKMEAVGQLAGGVAHDFNNLLTIIQGYGELVLSELPAGDPKRDLIKEVIAAGDRAAGLTRQLLAFSRKAILEPRVLDLKVVLADVEKLLRRIIGEDIQLAVVADPETGAVKADPGQIEQVLLNLVVNARDAMLPGGRITIELRNAELDEGYVRTHAEARAGAHVLLAVSDTGCGMDQATMARIFEPFFSTKGERGTGLGLATVHGIVKQSGGHVAVYSEVGHGTTFKVYLPLVNERPALGRSQPGPAVLPRGTETVLLVEDQDGVRALARHVLQDCGYTVLEARNGAEALQIGGQQRGQIDLLVTDVVMPRMGGRQVAERLAALRPGLKVLFLSGYTDDAVVRHGILEGQVAFLHKPFSPACLATKVREVLDRSEAPPSRSSREEAEEGYVPGRGVTPPTRILLVDDHSILRAGIRKILQKLPGIEVVAEACDGREALALVGDLDPDVVFMDIAMGGLNGLEATARLTQEFPDVRVIMLSMHADEEHVWKALRAGAVGYLLKHADLAEIELALETVVRGESYITPAVSQHIVAEFIRRGGTEASSVELLTSRQREILQLLAEGKTTKEIGRLLSISAKTVETHRAQVMERLDLHDLTGLVRYAIRVGLIHADA